MFEITTVGLDLAKNVFQAQSLRRGERPAKPIWRGLTIAGTLNSVERRSKATTHRAGSSFAPRCGRARQSAKPADRRH